MQLGERALASGDAAYELTRIFDPKPWVAGVQEPALTNAGPPRSHSAVPGIACTAVYSDVAGPFSSFLSRNEMKIRLGLLMR